ncbi:MAG TPA: hypothetical protein VLA49_11835 [Anaerolineales bacterium]|nr:hypothetical protein [Anaerolineales bacterium]
MSDNTVKLLAQAHQVASRLERLSPDSTWQRRASGTRGALLRLLEQVSASDLEEPSAVRLRLLVAAGYRLLESAAQAL